jgi:hypothetical protein
VIREDQAFEDLPEAKKTPIDKLDLPYYWRNDACIFFNLE